MLDLEGHGMDNGRTKNGTEDVGTTTKIVDIVATELKL